MPERALTTIDIAAQFAAKARAQTAAADASAQGQCTEASGSDRRDAQEGDSQTDGKRDLPKPRSLSDVQREGQFAEITAMVAELELQRAALYASVAALVEQLTLAGVTDRLGGADGETVDRVLADLLDRLVAIVAPEIEAAAQAQGQPLRETERAFLGGSQKPEWRALAQLLGRLH